jgi:alpha-glucosidase
MDGVKRTRLPAAAVLAFAALSAGLLVAASVRAQPRAYAAQSPDGETRLEIAVGTQVTYTVTHRGQTLLGPSPLSLTLDGGRVLGRGARVSGTRTRQVNETIRPVVAIKNAAIADRYTELRVEFRGGYALEARAYDDGVAWRWVTDLPDSITVVSEEATFRFAGNPESVVGLDSSFMTHQEPMWRRLRIDSLTAPRFALLPLLVDAGNGVKVAITESGLEDYAGMYLASTGGGTLGGLFPQAARAERKRNDRDVEVTERAPYLARTGGRRAFPWRAMIVSDADRELLESELVYKLAPATRLQDVSWIRPGKVAWDWWNALNVRGVPFRAGVNTETYKYFIDFAAKYGLPYIILDEGWYKLGNLLDVTPGVDVPELVRYGASKNVGVILWVVWKTLDDQMVPALDQFQKWGVKGIKVDFMQRDDQAVVNFYWRTAREAAARHLTVDFHGAHKPAGLNRAYPNVLSFEGVRGLENDKWSTTVTPEHDATLPFTRMLAGPMDYTPGAMTNAQPRNFRAVFDRPMSQGTRAHQLGMYVVYESPLQMLADSPSEYEREPETMEFLSAVPTVWDETRALDARVGDYALVARRSGDTWWVGALGDAERHALTLDLSFLGEGTYTMDAWADGPNADRDGRDYRKTTTTVTRGQRVEIQLAPGGGWAARLRRR